MYALLVLLMGKSNGTGPAGGSQWTRPELYYTVRLPDPQSVPTQSYHNHVQENPRYTVALYFTHNVTVLHISVFTNVLEFRGEGDQVQRVPWNGERSDL